MRLIQISTITCIFLITFIGAAESEDKPAIVNLIVNADVPASPTLDQISEAELDLLFIRDEIRSRNLAATIFSTEDVSGSRIGLRLTEIGQNKNFELGMSGNNSNERLSELSYFRQKDILERSKRYVESCRICGKNEILVKGFMPQSFDQNEETYNVLDDLGIVYNTGFKAKNLYASGGENEVWPYLVPGHKFYAVPVTISIVSGESVPLQDSYFYSNSLGASQWYDALVAKFDEIQGKDEPLVVILTSSVSGSKDYLDVLKRFMDYAISKNASFVTTMQLVELARTSERDVSMLPVETNVSEDCPTCDQSSNNISMTMSMNNSTQIAAA